MRNLTSIKKAVKSSSARSAWRRGVSAYALELLEEVDRSETLPEDAVCNFRMFEKYFLNGASDWSEYSRGGCSLIYNGDIAKRLCSPSELKKTRNGERKPNPSEEWLDTQARALYQAVRLLWDVVSK